jgi:threonine aldolase
MRQSGVLAAAALHALRSHRERLRDDHANAKRLAESLAQLPGVHVDVARVETNIVNVDLDVPAEDVATAARRLGLLVNASGPKRLRLVTHLDVHADDLPKAAVALRDALAKVRAG